MYEGSEGSEGRYQLSDQLVLNVRDYGAQGNATTDDTAAIQAAITACQTAGGGIVYLPAGTYKTSAPLLISSDKVRLVGAGRGVPYNPPAGSSGPCVLKPTGSAAFEGSAVLRFSNGTRSLWGCGVSDLAIAGYSLPANADGIYAEITESAIERVYVGGVTGRGIHLEGYSTDGWNNHLDHNYVQASGGDAFYFGANAPDNFLTGNTCYGVGGNGVTAVAPGITIAGNHLLDCTGQAISATLYDMRIVGNRIEDCNGGIYLAGTTGLGGFTIVGNKIWNCSIAADNTTDSINLTATAATYGGEISGNTFYTNAGAANGGPAGGKYRARYHINIASANVNDVTVGANSYLGFDNAASSYGTSAISDSGTGTQIAPIMLASSAVAASHTGNTSEVELASVAIPGGLIGANGRLRIRTLWSRNSGGAGNATPRVRLGGSGGTQYLNTALSTTNISGFFETEIANRGAQNSQVGGQTNGLIGANTAAPTTSAIDTSQPTTLAIDGLLATSTDTITLESYSVELIPG